MRGGTEGHVFTRMYLVISMNCISFVVQGSIVFDQIDAATKFRNTLSLTDLALLLSSCKVVKTFSFKAYNDKLII